MEEGNLVDQLKGILTLVDDRLTSLEHTVNDVLIAALKESAEEYDDNEKFTAFKTSYGNDIKDLIEPYKVLCGEDFDVERNLFDNLKEADGYGTEGFDEKSLIEAKIAEVKEKLKALQNMKEETKDETAENTITEDEEDNGPSEEQLAKEFAAAMGK